MTRVPRITIYVIYFLYRNYRELENPLSSSAETVVLAQGAASTTPVKDVQIYGTLPINSGGNFAPGAISMTGGNQPHPNQQPYLVVSFCISLQGIFPSRN
jgi:microcystin-dependent protein